MNKQNVRDLVDFVAKCLTITAIVFGAGWTLYQYNLFSTSDSNINVGVSTELSSYSSTTSILVIHAKPKNIGKVSVEPGKDGLVVSVKSIPNNSKVGILDIDALPVLYKKDLLKKYDGGYEIEPGGEYDEILAIVVPTGSTYAINAVLDLGDKTEVDGGTIVRVDAIK